MYSFATQQVKQQLHQHWQLHQQRQVHQQR
jgi:hypothetical protein